MKVIKGNKREGSGEIPPENMNGRAGVLGRGYNMNYGILEGKGRRNMNLNNNQGVTMKNGTPLKVMECTGEKGGCSEASV